MNLLLTEQKNAWTTLQLKFKSMAESGPQQFSIHQYEILKLVEIIDAWVTRPEGTPTKWYKDIRKGLAADPDFRSAAFTSKLKRAYSKFKRGGDDAAYSKLKEKADAHKCLVARYSVVFAEYKCWEPPHNKRMAEDVQPVVSSSSPDFDYSDLPQLWCVRFPNEKILGDDELGALVFLKANQAVKCAEDYRHSIADSTYLNKHSRVELTCGSDVGFVDLAHKLVKPPTDDDWGNTRGDKNARPDGGAFIFELDQFKKFKPIIERDF
ncbi:MAG: hypothetical protein IH984_07435 [Planctomycetes bacterium]|nr:hypothetical protein [Planctomycetota bacterium]